MFSRWKIKAREVIGPEECPQMLRWYFQTPFFGLRVHHFLTSDVRSANGEYHKHDHPWWFITAILRGRYIDVYDDPKDGLERLEVMDVGKVRFRAAYHRHRVVVHEGETCWTFVISGPPRTRVGVLGRRQVLCTTSMVPDLRPRGV